MYVIANEFECVVGCLLGVDDSDKRVIQDAEFNSKICMYVC